MILIPILLATTPVAEKNVPYIPESMPLVFQDEEVEDGVWTGSINFGGSATDGTNTDIKTAAAIFDATMREDVNRYTVGFNWNYSSQDGELTQRRTFGKGQYDRFLDEKSYVYGQLSAENDETSLLDLRTTAGVGYGYQFRDDAEWKVSGEVGLSYLTEKYDLPSGPGIEDEASYLAARLGYNWNWLKSERWTFSQSGAIFPALSSDGDVDSGDIYAKFDTKATATLTDNMVASLQWLLDYDETPARVGSAELDEDDNLFLLTVGWRF